MLTKTQARVLEDLIVSFAESCRLLGQEQADPKPSEAADRARLKSMKARADIDLVFKMITVD
jgi:hypothetical protein